MPHYIYALMLPFSIIDSIYCVASELPPEFRFLKSSQKLNLKSPQISPPLTEQSVFLLHKNVEKHNADLSNLHHYNSKHLPWKSINLTMIAHRKSDYSFSYKLPVTNISKLESQFSEYTFSIDRHIQSYTIFITNITAVHLKVICQTNSSTTK